MNKSTEELNRVIGRLREALKLTTATVELHTGNGAQTQPDWPRHSNGDINYEAVAHIGRSALYFCGYPGCSYCDSNDN